MTIYYFFEKKWFNLKNSFPVFKGLNLSLLLLIFFFSNANLFAQCPNDADCDLILNNVDLDDDNDGILDTNENTCGQLVGISEENLSNIDVAALHDGSSTPQTINASFSSIGCNEIIDQIQYSVTAFPSSASGSNEICFDTNSFKLLDDRDGIIRLDINGDSPCNGGVTYRINFDSGNEVLDISSFAHGNMTADETIIIRSTVPLSVNTFKKPNTVIVPGSNGGPIVSGNNTTTVSIDNVSGAFGGNRNVWEVSSNGIAVPYFEIEYYKSSGQSNSTVEAFSLFHAVTCDTDCDGTPDQFDLDSDDDGCSDSVEAGHSDEDENGILGNSPVTVDENGLVIGQGGYSGNNDNVTDPTITANCSSCESLVLDRSSINTGDCGANNGTIYLSIENRDFPHTFEWSNGFDQEDLLNASPGEYSMTLTDATGCTSVYGPFTIADPCDDVPCFNKPELIDLVITPADCEQENGAIDITVDGNDPPFTYFWSNGFATTEDVDNLAPGTYGVVVTDAEGCSVKFSQFIVEEDCSNACIAPTLDQLNISAGSCGNDDGGIYLSIENVNLPHTFIWNNGATTEDLVGVADDATYSMTLTDNKGCEFEFGPYTIPDACAGLANGSIGTTAFTNNGQGENFIIFPNPVSSNQQLNLEFKSEKEMVSFRLINTLGQMVRNYSFTTNNSLLQTQLDISGLHPGVYYLVSDDNQYQNFIVK